MPLLLILTLIITFWSMRLPGAKAGIMAYITPNLSRLNDLKVWGDAFSQIFFTLSLGFGIMIAYASYLPRKTQIVRDSFVICGCNCLFSLFAGFGVFAVLGYMAKATGQPLQEVLQGSEAVGLAFIAYPEAISVLPAFPQAFGAMFFLILVIAGLSSGISIIESFTSALIDKFHYPRKTVVSVLSVAGFVGSLMFATGAGLYWLDIVDHFITAYGLVVVALLECIAVGWFFKASKLRDHINGSSMWKLNNWWWDISVKIVSPIILFILLLSSLSKEISQNYGDYPRLAIIVIGRDWLIYTLFFAIVIAAHSWKVDPKNRMLK